MTRQLAVLLGEQVVATVERTRSGVLRLSYTGAGDGTPVSLSLPQGETTHTGARVRTFLEALLPESDEVRAAIGLTHGVDHRDVLHLLAAVGKDCAGAIQLCLPDEVDDTVARTGVLVPCTDADIESRLALLDFSDATWTMPGEHWSLGGTQGKFALRKHEGAWFAAEGAEPTTHIFKPGIRGLRAQALVEHISMRAAQLVGLEVAHTEYSSFTSHDAIVVTRFDRYVDDVGAVQRLHQEDVCQALGTSRKYEEYGGPSAADIAQLLRDVSPTAAKARANVERFLDGLIYNTIIGAPDAHARNYALLLNREDVTVAPLFDVATGLAYDTRKSKRVASMSIGGQFAFAQINASAWRQLASEVRVDSDQLLGRVQLIAEAVPAAMNAALAQFVGDPDADAIRDRLQGPLEKQAKRIVSETKL